MRIVYPNTSDLGAARSSVVNFVLVELPPKGHDCDFKFAASLLELNDLRC